MPNRFNDLAEQVLLVDVDSKWPNLALMKLSGYYKHRGYRVKLLRLKYNAFDVYKAATEISALSFSKVFVSVIFDTNKNKVKITDCDDVEFGGTGWDIYKKLPQEIDDWPEDYSIYPGHDRFSYGFITRGCIRNCSFCVVPKKEGPIYKYRNIKDIWRPGTIMRFFDNNILAYPECNTILQEIISTGMTCEFNQGLDIRLLDREKALLLHKLHYYYDYTFAFDDKHLEGVVEKGLQLFRDTGKRNRIRCFVYCNADMPIRNDVVYRIEWLHKRKCTAYVMRDVNCYTSPRNAFYEALADWCNFPAYSWRNTFAEFARSYRPKLAEWMIQLYNYG
jgi:hypothetical protein